MVDKQYIRYAIGALLEIKGVTSFPTTEQGYAPPREHGGG